MSTPNIAARRVFVACAFASAVVLSGCGGGGDSGSTAPAPPSLPPGTLDSSFGANGIVQTADIAFYSNAILLQSDGKIVAPGATFSGDPPNVTTSIALVRYDADGSLDVRFGTGGMASTPIESGTVAFSPVSNNPALSAALQSDGKILVLGFIIGGGPSGRCVLARFNPDGTLDGNFGAAGKIYDDDSYCSSLALQPDGRIVVVGSGFRAKRFNADGSRDTSFGVGGVATATGIPDGGVGQSMVLQPDGKITVIGWALEDVLEQLPYFPHSQTNGTLLLCRYNADGTPDSDFGIAGVELVESVTSINVFYASGALQADGKIVVASTDGVVRLNTNGALDSGFVFAGLTTEAISVGIFQTIAIQSNDKVVVGGVGAPGSPVPLPGEFMAMRLEANGSLDPTFGTGGLVFTQIGGNSSASAIAVQTDGRIVLAGIASVTPQVYTLAVARYFGDPTQ